MLNTLGIVEVSSSPHDAGRTNLTRRIAGAPLLEWIVRRVSEAQGLDQVVVVGPQASGDAIAAQAPRDVPLCLRPEADALARFAAVLRDRSPQAVVRVSLDNPLVDPVLVDRLIATAHKGQATYVGYCFGDGRPAVRSQLGVLAEWCRASAIQEADERSRDASERADVTRYIVSRPERFPLRLIRLPDSLDRGDVRLAVRGQEDWEHVQEIMDALGPERLDFQAIATLLEEQPAMRERMRYLNDQAEAGSAMDAGR